VTYRAAYVYLSATNGNWTCDVTHKPLSMETMEEQSPSKTTDVMSLAE